MSNNINSSSCKTVGIERTSAKPWETSFSLLLFCVALFAMAAGASSVGAADLTWNGFEGFPFNVWDTSEANWTGDSTTFSDGDNVTFDDNVDGGTVVVNGMSPTSTTVNNASSEYIFVSEDPTGVGAPSILTGTLVKDGDGILQLGPTDLPPPWQTPLYSNGFTSVTVNGGTLEASSHDAFGTGMVAMAGGTSFKMVGAAEGRYNFGNEDLANPFVLSGGLVNVPVNFGNTSKDIWLAGVVSGPGGFNITGTHRDLSLSGDNTFEGGVTVQSSASGGTAGAGLVIASYTALGTGPLTVGYNVITHWRHGVYAGENLDGITADPNGNINPDGIVNPITIMSGKYFYVDGFNDDMTLLLSGVISGDGTLGKDRRNSTVILAGANTYTGGTIVDKGTLTINGSLADATMTIDDINRNGTASAGIVNGSGTLTFNIDGATNDLIQVVNFATLDMTNLHIDFNTANLTEEAYVLVDADVIADPAVLPGILLGTEFASAASVPGYVLDYNYDGFNTRIALVEDPTAGTPGDFDDDGDVDGNDFLLWQRGESTNGGSPEDLVAWEANFGTTGPEAANTTAVPEPASLALLGLGGLMLLLRRRRA